MTRIGKWHIAGAVATLATCVLPVNAQAPWPTKPITYVVPCPRGDTDTLARLIAQKLSTALGQPVVIDNKPGAGGNIGSDFVAKAKPDGHTILGGTISSHAINPSVCATALRCDQVVDRSLSIGTSPLVLVTGVASPYKSLQDVVAAAKAKPGDLSFASAGSGTSPHLAGELLNLLAQVKMEHISYKGSGPAVTDVVAGHVPLMFDTTLVVGAHVKSGKLRPIAVTSAKRVSSMPDVPTAAESGVPGFEVATWQAIFAPAGTPRPIIDRLNSEIANILKQPDTQARLAELAVDVGGGSQSHYGRCNRQMLSNGRRL